MEKESTLSTLISSEVKKSLTSYCKAKGLKIRNFIEDALVEKLEDEIDIESYYQRKDEEEFSFDDVFK